MVALTCAILTVANASQDTLALLVIATTGLWAGATVRHTMAHRQSEVAIG